MTEINIGNLEFYNEVEIGDLGHDVKIINTGGGSSNDYNDLDNKPKINDVELSGNKSLSDLGITQDFVKDTNYVHTDNNYTDEDKKKLVFKKIRNEKRRGSGAKKNLRNRIVKYRGKWYSYSKPFSNTL